MQADSCLDGAAAVEPGPSPEASGPPQLRAIPAPPRIPLRTAGEPPPLIDSGMDRSGAGHEPCPATA